MRRVTCLLIGSLSLTGCGGASSDPDALAGLVVPYSVEQQQQAADELEALPEGTVLERMIGDYGVLREQLRAAASPLFRVLPGAATVGG